MIKYRITGPDAEAYRNRLVTRKVSKIAIGGVGYTVWCPTIKSNFAIANVDARYARPGTEVVAEIYYERELHWTKVMAKCKLIEASLFNLSRRRQTPTPAF